MFSIDSQYVQQTLVDLVRINSVNPSLSSDGKGEVEIGAYVAKALNDLGLDVTTYEFEPNRVNVVGILPGTADKHSANGRSLLLNAHMDTVGVEGMAGPFGAEIRNGRLYGRGAQDMKGSLAAMLGVAKAFVDGGVQLAGDLWITAVADEEYASIGMEHLVKTIAAEGGAVDAAIVTEPTELMLCRAHRGFIWYEDAALLAEAGIDTVLLGPVGAGLHSAEEWVDVQSVMDLTAISAETAVRFCQ